MKALDFLTVLVLASFQWECARQQTDALSHINDQEAKSILSQALEKAGGLEAWQCITKVEFEKTTTLFDQYGNPESNSFQQHRYFYRPFQVIDIHWQDSLGYHQIVKKDNALTKYLNKKSELIDEEQLLSTVLSSEYVVMLPFKLANENIELTYLGIETLEDQGEVYTIQARYNPKNPDSYDTTDIWWHYFDVDNLLHTGYKVKHADHISMVRNQTHIAYRGFIFPEKRSSYRVDDLGNVDYLRAEYLYANYLVTSDQ